VITKFIVMDWLALEVVVPVVPVVVVPVLPVVVVPVVAVDEAEELLIVMVPEQSEFTEYVPVKSSALMEVLGVVEVDVVEVVVDVVAGCAMIWPAPLKWTYPMRVAGRGELVVELG
jgi:hypothetical protein